MRKTAIFATVLFVAITACQQRRPAAAPPPEMRKAITTLYVAVPVMNVYAQPQETAQIISTFGYTESASVLSQNGGWLEVRTFDGGSGWAKANELYTSEQIKPFLLDPQPRFFAEPAKVPPPGRIRGEIVLEARVDTGGNVFDVKTISNTTGLDELAITNSDALRKARFFPLIKDNQRASFKYQYIVTY